MNLNTKAHVVIARPKRLKSGAIRFLCGFVEVRTEDHCSGLIGYAHLQYADQRSEREQSINRANHYVRMTTGEGDAGQGWVLSHPKGFRWNDAAIDWDEGERLRQAHGWQWYMENAPVSSYHVLTDRIRDVEGRKVGRRPTPFHLRNAPRDRGTPLDEWITEDGFGIIGRFPALPVYVTCPDCERLNRVEKPAPPSTL